MRSQRSSTRRSRCARRHRDERRLAQSARARIRQCHELRRHLGELGRRAREHGAPEEERLEPRAAPRLPAGGRDPVPARVEGYLRGDLDTLAAGGEVLWVGLEPLGERDGPVALYLADAFPRCSSRPGPPRTWPRPRSGGEARGRPDPAGRLLLRRACTRPRAAATSSRRSTHSGRLVWKRARHERHVPGAARVHGARAGPAASDGRQWHPPRQPDRAAWRPPPRAGDGRSWPARRGLAGGPSATEWSAAAAQQLLLRYGIVSRGAGARSRFPAASARSTRAASPRGGRADPPRLVAGVGAIQFAQPGVLDLLGSLRDPPEVPEVVTLAAADPANPYGAILDWPAPGGEGRRLARAVGARVILVDGALAAYLARGGAPALRVAAGAGAGSITGGRGGGASPRRAGARCPGPA